MLLFPGAAAARPHASSQVVHVSLVDLAIKMPKALKPGRTVFVVTNHGHYPHDFTAIWGPVRFHSPVLQPGASNVVVARLVPGAYVVACTVLNGGHLAEGMLTIFTVGTRAMGSGQWHYP